MEIEKINIEEVYGEPIDENDTIFKLSNSGKRAYMGAGDILLSLCSSNNDFRMPTAFIASDDIAIRIVNDRHEGILIDRLREFERNEKLSIENNLIIN